MYIRTGSVAIDLTKRCKLMPGRFDKQPTNEKRVILMCEKPGWGSREEKESNMSTEEQADDWCMGNMDGFGIVGVYWEATMEALQEAMEDYKTINRRPILSLATDKPMYLDTNIIISNNN